MKRSRQLPKILITGLISILLGFIGANALQINVRTDEKIKTITIEKGKIELTEEQIPFVEEIDGGMRDVRTFGSQGEFFRTDTYENFIKDTKNKCVIESNIYGAQCVSLAQAFWSNYAGRNITDCGTGAARGIWTCKEENAGDDFEIVEGSQSLPAGSWVIYNSGTYGHVGMLFEDWNGGYMPLYGENQGGEPCSAGGTEPNSIMISPKTMLGAFIPKTYISQPEPFPTPEAPDGGLLK